MGDAQPGSHCAPHETKLETWKTTHALRGGPQGGHNASLHYYPETLLQMHETRKNSIFSKQALADSQQIAKGSGGYSLASTSGDLDREMASDSVGFRLQRWAYFTLERAICCRDRSTALFPPVAKKRF